MLATVLRLDSHPSVEVSHLEVEVEVEVDLAVEVDDISAAAESSGWPSVSRREASSRRPKGRKGWEGWEGWKGWTLPPPPPPPPLRLMLARMARMARMALLALLASQGTTLCDRGKGPGRRCP